MADDGKRAGPEKPPTRSRLAVASLLRMADVDLRDADALETGRNPGNVPALARQAVLRMVDAVAVTEIGWKAGSALGSLGLIPDPNPLKASLAGLLLLLPSAGPPMPDGNGRAAEEPDRAALRDGMLAARTLLTDLAARFEVDLDGDGPAARITAVRPEPVPVPPARREPPPPKHKVLFGPSVVPKPTAVHEPGLRLAKRPTPPVVMPPVLPPLAPPIAPLPSVPPHPVEERFPIEPRPRPGSMASTAFWSLMDRWEVPDTEALALIGHAAGLTKKGTRPRFKLVGDEVDMLHGLLEIDAALAPLNLDAGTWLNMPVAEAPFAGATPLAYMVRARMAGIRATIRFLLQHGLRMSMAT